jgi:hypothetical protein
MSRRQSEGGGKQARLGPGELQVRLADRTQPPPSRGRHAVPTAHATDLCRHASGKLAHGRGAHGGEEFLSVGEVPVGGVRHHADHPRHFAQHDGVRPTGSSQLNRCADQAIADGAARATRAGGRTMR